MSPSRRVALALAALGLAIAAVSTALVFPVTHHASITHIARGGEYARTVSVGEHEKGQLSYDAFLEGQRTFPGATIPPDGYPRGVASARALPQAGSAVKWRELGPTHAPSAGNRNPLTGARSAVSGRATALAVVPSTCTQIGCETMYLGAANGGVWKTTDAGSTWLPITDRQISLAVGAITLDPVNPNIVYVATGEPNHSGDSFRGNGILRSADAGQHWTTLGGKQFLNRAVAAIIVDPRSAGTTNSTLYVVSTRAASGSAQTGGANSRNNPYLPPLGFYVSRDGGKKWTRSNPQGPLDGAQSLVMDPNNPDILYAGFNPDPASHPKLSRASLDRVSGVFKSTDDGKTWSHLTAGLPGSTYDTMTLAVAPSNSQVVYASYDLQQDSLYSSAPFGAEPRQGLYRSTNGGSTWSVVSTTPNVCSGQCSYDMPIAIDPRDPNVVYLGGTANYGYWSGEDPECATLRNLPLNCHATVAKTTDGGRTWADMGQNGDGAPIHPDDHAIVLNPKDPKIVYTATDGGLYWSTDGGESWKDLNGGLATLQFTGLALGRDGAIYAGTQDNGTFKYTGSTTWKHIASGDGGPTAADPKSASITYSSRYGPFLFRNDKGGGSGGDVYISAFAGDLLMRGLGQFYEPYAIAPSQPNVLYYGTYRVWRSKIRGGTDGNGDGDATNDAKDHTDWVPISFDLRCAKQPSDPTGVCGNDPHSRGISTIAVSASNPNVVAVGAANGRIWITHNALAPVKTDSSCIPWINIKRLSLCNYLSGPTWHEINRGLPGRYPTSLTFAPHSTTKLYVTFSGFDQNTRGHRGHVFASANGGTSWKDLTGTRKGLRLPNLPVTDLVVNTANGHLYVSADYGLYVSTDAGKSWRRMDAGLPATPVFQMQFSASRHVLVVATHGRGVWQTPAP